MTCTIERVATLRGVATPPAPSRKAKRPYATPALLFRAHFRLDDVECEVHVLDHAGRRAPARSFAGFLDGDKPDIGLDRYLAASAGGTAPPLGQAVRLLRPVVPIARGMNHAMQVEFLTAYQRPPGIPTVFDPTPTSPPSHSVTDVTTGRRSPSSRGNLAASVRKFGLAAAALWEREFLTGEYWHELARLEGVKYGPGLRPLAAGRATAVYLRDAAPSRWDRVDPPEFCRPRLFATHATWMERTGRTRVGRSCERVVAALRCSDDHTALRDNLGQMFDRP